MKVIAGLAKGHKLVQINKLNIRPTLAQVKESIFSFESCGLMWWNAGESGNSLIFMDGVLCDLLASRAVIVDEAQGDK